MSREELLALAERCEQATGPDRELDIDIYLVIRPSARGRIFDPPKFTASLDAAMTLADGFGGQVTFFKNGEAKAFLWDQYPLAIEVRAATPALALTAASLRARAADKGEL